jgi:replicative superfamily II helicase
MDVRFKGSLRPPQREAAKAMFLKETGVLCAGTGFEKTVIGAWLIAARSAVANTAEKGGHGRWRVRTMRTYGIHLEDQG